MTPDYENAAIVAGETLVKYSIKKTPVSPLQILEQMDNVILISFSEVSNSTGISRSDFINMLGKSRDAITSVHTENGKKIYVVAYNRLLPFNVVQRATARELAHIILEHEHTSEAYEKEAECFSMHLLCPRPLIHILQASGMRITIDLLSNLTGIFEQSIVSLRHLPGVEVPPRLNRFIRGQFFPFFMNFFDYYQNAKIEDGSALADLGNYMDGYEE